MQSIKHGTMGKMIVFDIRFSPSVSYSRSNEAQTRAKARDWSLDICRERWNAKFPSLERRGGRATN